ncbi:MAG: pilus assembly PilX N-terminal domain-containing protein [Patescibacteria group bacterium]
MFNLRKILKQNKKINKENLRSKFSPLRNFNFMNLKTSSGFVSMIALLLANIFLIIGLSVFNIALREFTLSSGSRESLFAFYAADGGMECALYWDLKEGVFATSTSATELNCNNQTIAITSDRSVAGDGRENSFSYSFIEGELNSPCVTVYLNKKDDGGTVIRSYGKNSCDESNNRRVERAWQVTY